MYDLLLFDVLLLKSTVPSYSRKLLIFLKRKDFSLQRRGCALVESVIDIVGFV